jgi:hypothetical protein
MSTKARKIITPDEFEVLKRQLIDLPLTDSQITDLALILKDKFQQNIS